MFCVLDNDDDDDEDASVIISKPLSKLSSIELCVLLNFAWATEHRGGS